MIQMILKGRNPNLKLVFRTHKVNFVWVCCRADQSVPSTSLRFVGTSDNDFKTGGSFSAQPWPPTLCLWQLPRSICENTMVGKTQYPRMLRISPNVKIDLVNPTPVDNRENFRCV